MARHHRVRNKDGYNKAVRRSHKSFERSLMSSEERGLAKEQKATRETEKAAEAPSKTYYARKYFPAYNSDKMFFTDETGQMSVDFHWCKTKSYLTRLLNTSGLEINEGTSRFLLSKPFFSTTSGYSLSQEMDVSGCSQQLIEIITAFLKSEMKYLHLPFRTIQGM